MDYIAPSLQTAVSDKVITGAVLVAADRTDTIYAKSFGSTSINADEARPLELDSVMWVASCTKLMTAVSALQCVERRLFTLDEPISRLIPEYSSPKILTGFNPTDNSPIFTPSTTPITLRHLLSHSSGLGYAVMNPLLTQYRAGQGIDANASTFDGTLDSLILPLTFNPGDGWSYGVGIDWAGQLVERANGGMRLGAYMAENIWKPLGMTSTSFNTSSRPDLAARLCGMTMRDPKSNALIALPRCPYPIEAPNVDCGGVGSLTTPSDYLKLLTSLLRNDGKLLQPESVAELFRPQLSAASSAALDMNLAHPDFGRILAPAAPTATQWSYSLGGIVAVDGIPGRAGAGTMWWGGMPNLQWFIDRERGTCGMYASQLLPPGDIESARLFGEFQEALFTSSGTAQPSL